MRRRRSDSAIVSPPGSVDDISARSRHRTERSARDRRNVSRTRDRMPIVIAAGAQARPTCAAPARRRRRATPSAPGRASTPASTSTFLPTRFFAVARSLRHAACPVGCTAGTMKICACAALRRDRLLLHAADLADVAVGIDRAGDRDPLAAGEVARRQRVDDRQRHRETGRRPADVARVDVDVHREVEAARELDADERRPVGTRPPAPARSSVVAVADDPRARPSCPDRCALTIFERSSGCFSS